MAEPKSEEAKRICNEDLNELVAAFSQDKRTIERGIFDEELVPEEITQVAMGKIVATKYPNLGEEDHEAVRQHAVAAVNMTQQVKKRLMKDAHQARVFLMMKTKSDPPTRLSLMVFDNT